MVVYNSQLKGHTFCLTNDKIDSDLIKRSPITSKSPNYPIGVITPGLGTPALDQHHPACFNNIDLG